MEQPKTCRSLATSCSNALPTSSDALVTSSNAHHSHPPKRMGRTGSRLGLSLGPGLDPHGGCCWTHRKPTGLGLLLPYVPDPNPGTMGRVADSGRSSGPPPAPDDMDIVVLGHLGHPNQKQQLGRSPVAGVNIHWNPPTEARLTLQVTNRVRCFCTFEFVSSCWGRMQTRTHTGWISSQQPFTEVLDRSSQSQTEIPSCGRSSSKTGDMFAS